jgi:glycosyltransferase involved in cell wall biosynthesis
MPLLRALGFRLVARHRVRQAVAFGRRHRAEMVWGELQGDALVLAQAVAEGLGVPLAGTVWDDPAGWLADGGCDRLSRRLLLRRFREALKAARSLSTAGEAMQRAYHRDYGVRSVILRHGFDAPARHQKSGNDGAITVGFVGSLYGRDAWSAFLSAAARLNASHRLRPIRLRVFGAAAFPYGCNGVQVDFRGWQPAEEMLREIALTDFCYLPYWFDPAKRRHVELSFPNKFETYLAAGRPVLFHGPSYAGIAEAVKQYGVGMCVHSLNEEEMTAALERLIRDKRLRESFGLAALAAFHAQFNATVMMEQFAELIGVDPGLLQQQRSATVPCAADTHE